MGERVGVLWCVGAMCGWVAGEEFNETVCPGIQEFAVQIGFWRKEFKGEVGPV